MTAIFSPVIQEPDFEDDLTSHLGDAARLYDANATDDEVSDLRCRYAHDILQEHVL